MGIQHTTSEKWRELGKIVKLAGKLKGSTCLTSATPGGVGKGRNEPGSEFASTSSLAVCYCHRRQK